MSSLPDATLRAFLRAAAARTAFHAGACRCTGAGKSTVAQALLQALRRCLRIERAAKLPSRAQ